MTRSTSMSVRVAAVSLLLAIALAGCTPVRDRVPSAQSIAADPSAATTECEAFACQP
jgi:hypothetical protein